MAVRKHKTETPKFQNIKRLRKEEEADATMAADRLTDMPESLQLRILSSLDAKQAIQTSTLSKSWVSSWTYIPVLNFNSYSFQKLHDFDKFVFKALSVRESVRLDKLTFKRDKVCSAKILERVFDYAFSHGVKELEAQIAYSRNGKGWPRFLKTSSSDSLTSLKLDSYSDMSCSFLKSGSGCFKNLTDLHLRRVVLTDLDPFSGFPVLQRLKLLYCRLDTIGKALNVHALQLSELTISYYSQYVSHLEFITPKLKYFKFQGINFPRIKTNKAGDLPILDTMIVDYNGLCHRRQEKMMFDDLLVMFDSLCRTKSLTVFSSIVHLLSLFPDELANRCSPFRDLKCLNLDFSLFYYQNLFEGPCRSLDESLRVLPGVKGYLLQKAHGAKCRVIHPNNDANEVCDRPQTCRFRLQCNTIKLEG